MVGSLRRLAQWIKPGAASGSEEQNTAPQAGASTVAVETSASYAKSPSDPNAEDQLSPEILRWIENTHRIAETAVEGDDSRIRTRSQESLDICATKDLIPFAINAFVTLLQALKAENIPVEIRGIDGWRVCAIVDDIPLAIRVKERRHRVPQLDDFSTKIERWMGGSPQVVLRPSGKVDLQVVRRGINSTSVTFDPKDPASSCKDVIRGLRRAAIAERHYLENHPQNNSARITVTPTSRSIRKFRGALAAPAVACDAVINMPPAVPASVLGVDVSGQRMSASLNELANASRPDDSVPRIQIPAGLAALTKESHAKSNLANVRRRRKVRKPTPA